MPRYNAEISAGSLMLTESRRIASLLLTNPTDTEWDHAIKVENILQKNTHATAHRQAQLLRKRLMTLDHEGWKLIAESEVEVSTQLLLAAAIKHSHLLGDFLRDVYARQIRRMELALNEHLTTWRRMLEALHRFEPNRPALTKESVAANALQQLETIRDNLTPYQQVNQIEPLIQSVEAVNAKLVEAKREHALLLLEKKITEVNQALDQAHAQADLRNRALMSLQQIKLDIAAQTSIPQIHYLQEQSGNLLDSAMDMISAALKSTTVKPPLAAKATGDSSTAINLDGEQATQAVTPLPAKVIRAADYSSKSYLESEAEVEEYITKLRAELMAAIKAGQRARIQ